MIKDDITIRYDAIGDRNVQSDQSAGDVCRTLRVNSIAESSDISEKEFVLRGVTYYRVRTLSNNSGEAQVFLVNNNGKDYVLKLYYFDVDIKHKALKVISNIDFDMIVNIYDFGYIYVGGKKRFFFFF